MESKQNKLKALKINSNKDLRQYILNSWLELTESEKPEIKIQALKEISKYLFHISNCNDISIAKDLKNEDEDIFNL
jgi:hypothetical protein